MGKKQMSWKTRGMNRDLSVSAFNPEFAFENRNLRLSTNESNTLMSWVNEKGTKEIKVSIKYLQNSVWETTTTILGNVIGTAILNHQLVLFTHADSGIDRIYTLHSTLSSGTSLEGKMIFYGNLNFDAEHPLETLVSYESEKIQKVYWTDNKNQPRVINIAADDRTINKWYSLGSGIVATYFDFVRTLKLDEDVSIKKLLGASGMFPAGVIQYAFTYFDKYGQESNIFYTSPILYTSHLDRGGSPEDKVDNAFRITVDKLDTDFDYLRIYSIMRTSINGTPICKRVQDISITDLDEGSGFDGGKKAVFIDNGTVGDTVDPQELLYKGGEEIIAGTIEQKDGTLFLGNIKITRRPINDFKTDVENGIAIDTSSAVYRKIYPQVVSTDIYPYSNQLTSTNEGDKTVPCGGFKRGEHYRLGVQFQYKTGKWSDPICCRNEITQYFSPSEGAETNGKHFVNLPIFQGTLGAGVSSSLYNAGYLKVRPVCVFPNAQDMKVLCQGVVNPTMSTDNHRYSSSSTSSSSSSTSSGAKQMRRRRAPAGQPSYPKGVGDLQAQASWFFRCRTSSLLGTNINGSMSPYGRTDDYIPYYSNDINWNPDPFVGDRNIRQVEIQGIFDDDDKFYINDNIITLNSPDIEFDTQLSVTDFTNTKYQQVGHVDIIHTLSDMDIQTETPAASAAGSGFIHRAYKETLNKGIVSGLFWDDFVLDDQGGSADDPIGPYERETESVKWMVYLWNRSGSLNNDISRGSHGGVRSAVLKKKIISNFRIADTFWLEKASQTDYISYSPIDIPQIFNSEDNTIAKIGEDIYRGNIDTILIPKHASGFFFSHPNDEFGSVECVWRKLDNTSESEQKENFWYYSIGGGNVWIPDSNPWDGSDSHIGNVSLDLLITRSGISMKYKSTPHLVFKPDGGITWEADYNYNCFLPIVEITKDPGSMAFGGVSSDALKANNWLPCGEPVNLNTNGLTTIRWEYGDTYYQRWDCLKTYAFTPEDENQVVEIGSFMLETRTNIDGRYDRNRGQMSNLYMSPINFNLMNPVYSQQNNFFTYKILDSSYYEDNAYPNQIIWSLTKASGADVDAWTNVSLASNLELDGDKGVITKLTRINDQLYAFQDTGISQILYNERVQVVSTEGIPIEIANSNKVDGERYLSNTVGCSNKWSMASTPSGVYFMDSNGKDIYLFNGQLSNISTTHGFNTWCKKAIPAPNAIWTPTHFGNFVSYYDKNNQEVMFINGNTELSFSEKLGAFTSFYDYGHTPYFCSLDDVGIWIRNDNGNGKLWKHQGGEKYCNFFDEQKSYGTILVGNPEPTTDKIFTNLEFRACVDNNGTWNTVNPGEEDEHKEFSGKFFLPFDYLETWNEYQHGVANLQWKNGSILKETMRHHLNDTKTIIVDGVEKQVPLNSAHLARKFRIWRCDIPRDNAETVNVFDYTFDDTFHNQKVGRSIDRMRNPWLYLKLKKDPNENGDSTDKRVEIHDMVMTYYN